MNRERLLAVDCSMRITGVALSEEGRAVASESLDLGRRQSAELPIMAERLLSGAGWSLNDISFVAVTNGPGYFTGIRVGAAWASALAYGLGVPVIPVSSLAMLSGSSGGEARGKLAVVYAGRKTVYAASFGCPEPLMQGEYTGVEIAEWLRGRSVDLISDDAERAGAALAGTFPEGGGFPFPISVVRPDAAKLSEMAWLERDAAVSPMELRVNYCRAPL